MMVPDAIRGRVMGFYSMTYSISPLGALQAGVLANLIGTPIAIAIGGLAVVGFAVGSATVNNKARNLGTGQRPKPATVSLIIIGVTCLSDVRHAG